MRRLAIVVGVCAVLCLCAVASRGIGAAVSSEAPAATQPAAKDKLPEGFKRLFDGKTLDGWKGRPALWKVQDGAIRGQTSAQVKLRHNEFLYTTKEYGDFELRLKFRLRNHNSGVQVRSAAHEDYRVTGYQADIAEKRYAGILYEEGGRGILADVDPTKTAKHIKQSDWNDYRILCQGNRIQFWINGQQTVNYTEKKDSARKKGVIGLQLHVGPVMMVEFKDIFIRELAAEATSQPARDG